MIHHLSRAAWLGAGAGFAYAAVESLFLGVAPWLVQPADLYEPLPFSFTAILFVLYPATCAVLAALLALVLLTAARKIGSAQGGEELLRAAASLSIAIPFATNLLPARSARPELFLFGILWSTLCVVALLGKPLGRLHTLINPWFTCFVLVGSVWFNRVTPQGFVMRLGMVLAYGAALFTVGAFLSRRAGSVRAVIRRTAGALAAFAIIGVALLLERGLYVRAPQTGSSKAGNDRPNVLLVVMDTVRADHTSLGGYERNTTPHLAELARSSATFLNAYAASDWTLPSHASLFTSLYPGAHGAYCNDKFSTLPPLSDRFQSMAEYLNRAGYTTMGVSANQSGIQRDFGIHQGFHYFSCRNPTGFWSRPNRYYLRHAAWSALRWAFPKAEPKDVYRRADDINREVLELIDQQRPRKTPFFLFVNYMDAHDPYEPRAPYDTKFPGKDLRFGRKWYVAMKEDVLRLHRSVSVAERRHMVSQYDGGISLVDASIAALLRRLKDSGLFDNTLIVVTSDHGEAFGRHHHVGHANSVYNNVIRVPLLIKFPGSSERRISSKPVSLVDVLPTVLDVVGIKATQRFHGRSLRASPAQQPDRIFSESYSCSEIPRLQRTLRAMVSHRAKLIHSSKGPAELYDLAKDPDETQNLAANRSMLVAALLKVLSNWTAGNVRAARAAPPQLDQKAIERLKTLGYVQ